MQLSENDVQNRLSGHNDLQKMIINRLQLKIYPSYGKIKNASLEPDFTHVKTKMTLSIRQIHVVEQIKFENILNIQNEQKKATCRME